MPGRPPPERQCKATSKQTKQRCKQWTTPGKEVCHDHGGYTPTGIEHPSFKHGRYSKSIPDRLVSRYEQALSDEERHDLRDEIALSEAKVDQLLAGMEHGESDTLWLRLRALEGRMSSATDAQRAALLTQILSLIQKGGDEALAWKDVDRWIYRKHRAVESDVRVAQIKQEMVSAEEVMALVAAILDSIRRHVEDQQTRSALARDIRAIGSGTGDVVPIDRARGAR